MKLDQEPDEQMNKIYGLIEGNLAEIDGFFKDGSLIPRLEKAWAITIEQTEPNPLALIRLLVIRSSVKQLASILDDNDLQTLVRLGRDNEAVEVALDRGVPLSEGYPKKLGKVDGLLAISEAFKKKGKTDIPLLIEAKKSAEQISPGWERDNSLYKIAEALIEAGCTSEIEEIVQFMGEGFWRNHTLYKLAIKLIDNGGISESLQIIDLMDDNYAREDAKTNLVISLTKSGRYSDADKILLAIENDCDRAWALSQMAKVLVRQNEILAWQAVQSAEKIIATIQDPLWQAINLRGLATAIHILDRNKAEATFTSAIDAVHRIDVTDKRKDQLTLLSLALLKIQDKRAQDLINEITLLICSTEEGENQLGKLLELAEKLLELETEYKGVVFDRVEIVLIKAYHEALKIDDSSDRAGSLKTIAFALSNAGSKHAIEAFREAERATLLLEDDWDRNHYLSDLVESLSNAGLFDDALRVSESIEKENRSTALKAVALNLAAQGEWERSRQTVRSMKKEPRDEWSQAIFQVEAAALIAGDSNAMTLFHEFIENEHFIDNLDLNDLPDLVEAMIKFIDATIKLKPDQTTEILDITLRNEN